MVVLHRNRIYITIVSIFKIRFKRFNDLHYIISFTRSFWIAVSGQSFCRHCRIFRYRFLILYILYLTFVRGENVNASVNAFLATCHSPTPSISWLRYQPLYAITFWKAFWFNLLKIQCSLFFSCIWDWLFTFTRNNRIKWFRITNPFSCSCFSSSDLHSCHCSSWAWKRLCRLLLRS